MNHCVCGGFRCYLLKHAKKSSSNNNSTGPGDIDPVIASKVTALDSIDNASDDSEDEDMTHENLIAPTKEPALNDTSSDSNTDVDYLSLTCKDNPTDGTPSCKDLTIPISDDSGDSVSDDFIAKKPGMNDGC